MSLFIRESCRKLMKFRTECLNSFRAIGGSDAYICKDYFLCMSDFAIQLIHYISALLTSARTHNFEAISWQNPKMISHCMHMTTFHSVTCCK